MVSGKVGTYLSVCPSVIALCFSLLNVKDDWQMSLFPWHQDWEERKGKEAILKKRGSYKKQHGVVTRV